MLKVALLGKEYRDTIISVSGVKVGETNNCSKIINKKGGVYNFLDAEMKNLSYHIHTTGIKNAYIVSDTSQSKRTSFVIDKNKSKLSTTEIEKINMIYDWLHISYLDDFECYEKLVDIKIPFSVDFCTTKKREQYLEIMKKAAIIFDSRERKHLYNDIVLKAPIVLHDEFGFEIITNSILTYKEMMTPLNNLNVNGAGDVYSGFFIENYVSRDIIQSARTAMKNTTKFLIHKGNI